MNTCQQLLVVALLGAASSCATPELQHEPWSQIGKGTQSVGVSTGWGFYGADVSVKGLSGVLAPGGVSEVGVDNTDLTPRYGGALKYNYFFNEHFALGGIFELRSFDPDPIMPLTAELRPGSFETLHFLASSRYWFDGLEKYPRMKPFVGLDLGYIPSVDFGDIEVVYPSSSGIPRETISATGSDYFTISPVLGMSYLVKDKMSFDFGAFYDFPLTESEDEVTFQNLGGARARARAEPEGLIIFAGLSFYF